MLHNLFPHENIKIRYSAVPVFVNIDDTQPHNNEVYPVEIHLAKVDFVPTNLNGDAKTNVSRRNT